MSKVVKVQWKKFQLVGRSFVVMIAALRVHLLIAFKLDAHGTDVGVVANWRVEKP